MTFLKDYGDTEGPLGFPMKDADAKALDAILQANPDAEHVRLVVQKATTEFSEGERADVAWIQTEAVDHDQEIVLASGFRDDAFKGNPIVTLNHSYDQPPVGRSLWRKKIKDGARRGVKAKTIYPTKPDDWTDAWAPDSAWGLVKASLMVGKSIGFLTVKSRAPTEEEIKRKPEWAGVRRIVEEWILLEYACCWLPMNPEALVEAVSKSQLSADALKFVGAELPPPAKKEEEVPPIAFTPLYEIEKAIERATRNVDAGAIVRALVAEASERVIGRI
jgi:hypothetical protein